MNQARLSVSMVLAALAVAGSATAQSAASLQAFKQASVAVAAAIAQADAAAKPPPTLADPDTAPQIRAALDPLVLAQIDAGDVAGLMDACSAGSAIARGYVLFGLKAKLASKGAQPSSEETMRATIETANANTERFQDEMAQANRFNIACNARALPALAKFAAALPPAERTPVRRDGLMRIRRGAAEAFQGVVLTQVDPIKTENRRIVLDEALSRADVYAAAMGTTERQSVIAVIDRVLATPSLAADVQEKLKQLRAGLGRTDCTGLCNLWADTPAGG